VVEEFAFLASHFWLGPPHGDSRRLLIDYVKCLINSKAELNLIKESVAL